MAPVRICLALIAAAALAACDSSDESPAGTGGEASPEPAGEGARAVAESGIGGGGEAAPSASGATVEIDRETYTVRVQAPESAGQGERGRAAVHVVPKDGWKMNHEFPMRLKVTPPEGVAVEGSEQSMDDAVHYSDARGEWAVGFTPEAAGEADFEADFRFAVCTDDVCVPKREKLAWSVDVP